MTWFGFDEDSEDRDRERPEAWRDGERPEAWRDGERPEAWGDGERPEAWGDGERPEAWRDGERPEAGPHGSTPEHGHELWLGGEADRVNTESAQWPLDPQGLYPRERWLWFEQLWRDACVLRERYRLALRAGWWEDAIQVEAIAALAAWVQRYDSGEWDDPPGKLALLYDLERVSLLLRDGRQPFSPPRDRRAFLRYLLESGCQPPPEAPAVA